MVPLVGARSTNSVQRRAARNKSEFAFFPDRFGTNLRRLAVRNLAGFSGVLQVDGYAAYNALTDAKWPISHTSTKGGRPCSGGSARAQPSA